MQTINITAYTEDVSQIEAVKAILKALKIKFEITKENPEVCLLSNEQKNAIDEAIQSIETKGTTTNNMVMEETKKRFPHLYNR